jgi:putative membrane protein
VAANRDPSHATGGHVASHRRLAFRAPSPPLSVGIIAAESLLLAALFGLPPGQPMPFLSGFLLIFLLPTLLAGFLTGPVAAAFGGRLPLRRSLLLTLTAGVTPIPLAIGWRLAEIASPGGLPATVAVLLFLQGPVLWFRHMSLYGISKPTHLGSLAPSLVGPLLSIAGIFVLFPPTGTLLLEAALFLLIGFLASALLLQAADRPLRREFGVSGVSLMRPILDHINERDAEATEYIEGFFAKFSVPADLRVTLLSFRSGNATKATIALPTVHPGPFASLGSSNLPRRLAERLGPEAGVVFVPHTPCNHDLDLPTSQDFERVASETQRLFRELPEPPAESMASPLVGGGEGSYARTQLLGDTAFVVVTQAPEPTDDIDFSVVDPLVRATSASGGPRLAIVDAHNSYIEGRGDLSYGMPGAEKLTRDIASSLARARSLAQAGPIRVGVAVRTGYSMREEGVGPEGVRALVIEAAGTKTAYVLIDGNNLVIGHRARLLEALRPLVDAAEVMTTDNHIVHEVDGSTNAIGERYPVESLARDVVQLVTAALADLSVVRVASGTRTIPAVRVLQPDWTARLLTSLGDTLSMFSNAFLSTFLLVLTSSLVVLLALR